MVSFYSFLITYILINYLNGVRSQLARIIEVLQQSLPHTSSVTTAPAKIGAMMDVMFALPLLMPMSIRAKLGARSRWLMLKPM